MTAPLAGAAVLVTRPAERAGGLIAALESAGAQAIRFPVISIEPLAERAPRDAGHYDAVLFVSPAAVEHAGDAIGPATGPLVGAVGPGTASALRERGVGVTIETRASRASEGLLQAAELAAGRIAGWRVLIVRGEGGRAYLAEQLVARGATVDYADVYRRTRPQGLDPSAPARCSIVTLTSNEGVDNLLALVDDATRRGLVRRPLAVASNRTAEHARSVGLRGPIDVAGGADDSAMLRAVQRLHDLA